MATPSTALNALLAQEKHPVTPGYAKKVQAAITTYRREKTYLYGHYLITGLFSLSPGLGGRAKRLCAPLILQNASLSTGRREQHGHVEPSSIRWNTSLLSLLIEDKNAISNLEDALFKAESISPEWITQILMEHNPNKDIHYIDHIDKASQIEVEKKSTRSNQLKILHAGAFLLAKRSVSSRGIIDELKSIADDHSKAPPLDLLFEQQWTPPYNRTNHCDTSYIPGILSQAQTKAILNSARESMSLVIGPPGTGKSYTIASIVLERFMQGQSVLVVSQNEFAVDVIRDKLVEQFGLSSAAIVRAGSKDYLKKLKRTMSDLTKGIGLEKLGKSQRRLLKHVNKEIKKLESVFNSYSNAAVEDGLLLNESIHVNRTPTLFKRFRLWRQQRRIEKTGLLYDLLKDIQDKQKQREDVLSTHINHQYLRMIHKVLKKHRKELVKFNSAIRARNSLTQETRFADINYNILLKALPIWLCSLSSLHKALPLKAGLFDLVIIDEATQCDIASCIPALYRAKRATIVGDPKQLRHISFLSRQKQVTLQEKNELKNISLDLNYRDKSMIDYADNALSSQRAVVMLDEHYRSAPEIIHFSNQFFYNNSLRIMTEKPGLSNDKALQVIHIEHGQRIKGINQAEIDAITTKLRSLIDDQKKLPAPFKLSIGVLSFFREQAEKIQKDIFKHFELDDLSEHKLRAGTPYSFQGEERDIMLISCCVDPESNAGVYTYLNRPDVFNVSITRARDQQLIYTSVDINQIPQGNLLRQLLSSVDTVRNDTHSHDLERDENIEKLSSSLQNQGMTLLRHYPIAGITMDLVAIYESYAIAIDLIGFPGSHQDALHIERYKIFERAGLSIFPLSYPAWVYHEKDVIDNIKSAFEELAINPINKNSIQISSKHWTKLVAINSLLAKQVRELEFKLVDSGLTQGLEQLGSAIERYQKFLWVLNQKLSPHELTYLRQAGSAEQAFYEVIDNLTTIATIKKNLVVTSTATLKDASTMDRQENLHSEQQASIQTLFTSNESIITSLVELAHKWSQFEQNKNENNIVEILEKQRNSIDKYKGN